MTGQRPHGQERPRIYLAGPDVFYPNAKAVGEAKRASAAAAGFEVVFPLFIPDTSWTPEQRGLAIFDACADGIRTADVMIANCTPFRSVSMDVGTAIEMGMAYALGQPVFAYTNDPRDYNERFAADGMDVEAFGFIDNLMVEGVVRRTSDTPVRVDAADEMYSSLAGYERCLAQVAAVRERWAAEGAVIPFGTFVAQWREEELRHKDALQEIGARQRKAGRIARRGDGLY